MVCGGEDDAAFLDIIIARPGFGMPLLLFAEGRQAAGANAAPAALRGGQAGKELRGEFRVLAPAKALMQALIGETAVIGLPA